MGAVNGIEWFWDTRYVLNGFQWNCRQLRILYRNGDEYRCITA